MNAIGKERRRQTESNKFHLSKIRRDWSALTPFALAEQIIINQYHFVRINSTLICVVVHSPKYVCVFVRARFFLFFTDLHTWKLHIFLYRKYVRGAVLDKNNNNTANKQKHKNKTSNEKMKTHQPYEMLFPWRSLAKRACKAKQKQKYKWK